MEISYGIMCRRKRQKKPPFNLPPFLWRAPPGRFQLAFESFFGLNGVARLVLSTAGRGENKCKSQSQRQGGGSRWRCLGWQRFFGRQPPELQRGRAVQPPKEKINLT